MDLIYSISPRINESFWMLNVACYNCLDICIKSLTALTDWLCNLKVIVNIQAVLMLMLV